MGSLGGADGGGSGAQLESHNARPRQTTDGELRALTSSLKQAINTSLDRRRLPPL
jgi:hypothetical protein